LFLKCVLQIAAVVAEQTMERVRKAVFNWEAAGRPAAASNVERPGHTGKGKVASED